MLRQIAPALLLSLIPLSAEAATYCFEDLGNTGCPWKETFPKSQLKQLSCQNLWYVRNSIYDRKGYASRPRMARTSSTTRTAQSKMRPAYISTQTNRRTSPRIE